MSNNWIAVKSCSDVSKSMECMINEGDILNDFNHKPGHNVICKAVATYTNGDKQDSRSTSFDIVVHQPYHLDSPTLNDNDTPGAISVSWVDEDPAIELHCKAPGQNSFSRVNTFGLNSHLMHTTCDQAYGCILIRKNVCYLPPTVTPPTIFTPRCPVQWTPSCQMVPECREDALQMNRINYVRVLCSSPPADVDIENFKFEIRTAHRYADNTRVWAEYTCGSSRNAPACMIPMADLAMHPFMLMDNRIVKGRVTATPSASSGLSVQTNECQPKNGTPVLNQLPPKAIALTITKQTSNQATVCWSAPHSNNDPMDTIHLFWSLQ